MIMMWKIWIPYRSMLAVSIGYSSVNNTFRRCLAEIMDEGKAVYLYSDNPKDKRQRICLHRTGYKNNHGCSWSRELRTVPPRLTEPCFGRW